MSEQRNNMKSQSKQLSNQNVQKSGNYAAASDRRRTSNMDSLKAVLEIRNQSIRKQASSSDEYDDEDDDSSDDGAVQLNSNIRKPTVQLNSNLKMISSNISLNR